MSDNPKTPEEIAAEDPRNTAVDIDIPVSGGTGHGSGFHLGDGVVITASHVGENANGTATDFSRMNLKMTRSPFTSDRTDRVGSGDFYDVGNYAGDPSSTSATIGANNHDIAAIKSELDSDINSSLIVFENPNDASGTVETLGFPSQSGSSTFTGANPYYSSGSLSQNSMSTTYRYNTLVSDKDHPTDASRTGMDAIGGQSGSQVQLDYDLVSADDRLGKLDLDDKVVGVVVHGSLDSSGVSHTASSRGVGIEEFDQQSYNGIGTIAEQAAQENSVEERYDIAVQAAKDSGNRLSRSERASLKSALEASPLDDRQIADRFADNVMVSNQQGVDGSSSTFNGSIFNETNYANQNVNMTLDMKGGYDTADYFVVGAGKGLTVEIGADVITVQKSYTTEEQVQKDVVTDGISTQHSVTKIKSHNATDRWRNTEAVIGSGSDDSFLINDLSGVQKLDGRDLPSKADGTSYAENDSLSLGKDVGPMTWEFDKNADGSVDRENGWVSDGANKVRFENMETVNIRDGDTVDGVVQGATATPIQTGEISVEDAIGMLAEDQKSLEAAYTGGTQSPAHIAISHPDAAAMFNNLYEHGVHSLRADITPDMSPEDRVSELLTAGHEATLQAGIDMPEQQRMAEAVQEQYLEQSYEDDYSYGLG